MSVPSCVSFRDQEVLMDTRKAPYGNWSRLETYCHLIAAKKAMRTAMDDFENVLIDGLKIAKELYRRGVIHKSSVDNCDPAQFADIPDFTLNKNSFFSCMFRTLDNNFKYWFVFLDVLRMYPECREATDAMEELYRKALIEIEVEKYQVPPKVASPEEAKVLFEELCTKFEGLWTEACSIMDTLDEDKLKNNVRLCYLDETERVEPVNEREEMYKMLRSRVDLMNLSSFDAMMMGAEVSEFQEKVRSFGHYRALTCARIRIKDFAYQLENNPIHKRIHFDEGPSMQLCVSWDEDEVMFRFFWLFEVVFATLSRHQYFHHIDLESYGFWFYLPDWMRHAMVKMTREHQYSLVPEGVCRATVLNEMTIVDPRWNITQKDYYDFMDSIIKIKNGRVVDVDETLEGLKPMRRWETMDVDKRLDSITDYVDEWPEAVPFPPQTISMSGFMSLYETNHLWISHPFFTRKRGFKLCVLVYPRGTRSGLNSHVSMGVCLMRGENDHRLEFPVKGDLTIQLLNQIGNDGHVRHTFTFNDTTNPDARRKVEDCNDFAPVGICAEQFIPLSLLDYNDERGTQYLANDTIFIQVMEAKFVHRQ